MLKCASPHQYLPLTCANVYMLLKLSMFSFPYHPVLAIRILSYHIFETNLGVGQGAIAQTIKVQKNSPLKSLRCMFFPSL